MNGANKPAQPTSPPASGDSLKNLQRALLGLFLIAIGFLIATVLAPLRLPMNEGACDTVVLLLALATTLVSLSSQLPAQNVLLAAVVIGLIGGGIETLGAATGIPFGPVTYTEQAGPRAFNAFLWFFPIVWIVAILNARGVARLILRPWRKIRVYGFWLIGITTLLTVIWVLGMEPFATRVRHYWIWGQTKLAIDWYGVPLTDFLGWLVTALLILAFATPALMKRKPAKSSPDYHPLLVWLALNILFIAGSFAQHLWASVTVNAIVCLIVIPFAIRGAQW